MRILHVIPTYLPATRYGGPVFSTHALCAALVRRNCEVTVFTTNIDGPGELDVQRGSAVSMDGVKVWYFPSSLLRRLYYSPQMRDALVEKCGGFDILHLHSVFLWPTWAAARIARRATVPYLLAPRGMLVKELFDYKSRWKKKAWMTLIDRKNIESAAGIHVTSKIESEELRRFGFTLPPIYEVPNGIDSAAGDQPSEALSDSIARLVRGGAPLILSLGRINWKKGLDRLIAALAFVPEANLLIVGNDEEEYTATLLAVAERCGVLQRVTIAAATFGNAKRELYRHATVFALASHSENFGNVVLEAMAEGCPVVVTPQVGAARIVAQVGAGLVASGEPPAFGAALREILSNAPLRRAIRQNAPRAIREHYSWDAVAVRMIEAYRAAITQVADAPK